MQMAVFWDAALCSLLIDKAIISPMVEAVSTSKTSVVIVHVNGMK
jgi:hypothetical protein